MRLPQSEIESFRDYFQRLTVGHDLGASIIKNILLVGAQMENGKLKGADEATLYTTISKLKNLGIPVASDFDLSLVNLEYDQGGENFLTGTYEADLIIFCWVFYPEFPSYLKGIVNKEFWYAQALNEIGDHTVARDFWDKDKWREAALRTGAKSIVTHGTDFGEVHEPFFAGDEFKIQGHEKPLDTIGILVRNDYNGPLKPEVRSKIEELAL
jgi:hypothetical protein